MCKFDISLMKWHNINHIQVDWMMSDYNKSAPSHDCVEKAFFKPLRYSSDLGTPAKQTNRAVVLCGCKEDDAKLLPLNEMIHS